MKDLRTSRRLIKMWQRRKLAVVGRLVRTTGDAPGAADTTHSAHTSSGLAVEDQIRKAWHPYPAGPTIF